MTFRYVIGVVERMRALTVQSSGAVEPHSRSTLDLPPAGTRLPGELETSISKNSFPGQGTFTPGRRFTSPHRRCECGTADAGCQIKWPGNRIQAVAQPEVKTGTDMLFLLLTFALGRHNSEVFTDR